MKGETTMNLKHKRILLLISCILLIGAVILMCLPTVAIRYQAGPDTPPYVEYYTYYSLPWLPVPSPTLIFTALWLLLSLWKTAADQNKGSGVLYWVLVGWVLLLGLWPVAGLFLDAGYMLLVTLLLFLAAGLQIAVYSLHYRRNIAPAHTRPGEDLRPENEP